MFATVPVFRKLILHLTTPYFLSILTAMSMLIIFCPPRYRHSYHQPTSLQFFAPPDLLPQPRETRELLGSKGQARDNASARYTAPALEAPNALTSKLYFLS